MYNPTTMTSNQWKREIQDLIRGASGGFLFGIPLLYTMEVWWIGSTASPPRMLIALAATFVVLMLVNRTAGFRQTHDFRLTNAAMDTTEALAIGILCTAIVLVLLREVTWTSGVGESLGKIIFESVPFALGVAVANQLLSTRGDEAQQAQPQAEGEQHGEQGKLSGTLADVGATIIGAIFIAFNIAPTDEIPMLAAAISPPWLLAISITSLFISYAIVFVAGFADQQKRQQQQGIFQRPLSETIASYLVSLLTAVAMLWFFKQLSANDPWDMWLSYTILLGLPATVGGAAGRLAV